MLRRYRGSRSHWQRRTALAVAVAACFAGNAVLANPTGPAVAHGQATFAKQGNTLTVTNTPGTIINWQGFSIAGNEIARFIQQSQSSSVLNRVVGINPSAILGTLQSNGRVFLINPNGITIGPGANIDVAGFLASTLNLSDADFLAGRMRFVQTPGAASVVNQGTITTATGGMVYLVGQDVQNSGIIRSPQGEIMLAAGKSIELVDAQTPEVRVQVTAPDNQVLNLGELIAAGGRIGMYGTLLRHSGVANANTAVVGENGKIVFKAIKDVTLDAGSVTTASGPQGGSVTVQAENGTLLVSGTVAAKGDAGKGGMIQLTGDRVGLIGNAAIDASGLTGGGSVLVGGDFQGRNAEVQNAWRTYVGAEASIKADAIESGHGGKVIVWADDITRAYGTISARGGPQGGDGGFVEVSGKNQLDFAARVDASAPMGAAGTLLLDPTNITVANAGVATTTQVDAFADAGGTLSISPATLNAAGTTVVLQATQDITVNDTVNLTTVNAGFVAQAGRHIDINAPITTNGGHIHIEADSPHSGANLDGIGIVTIGNGAAVNSNGGAITLIGGGNSNPNGGGFVINDEVNAGSGGINVSLTQTGALDFFIGAGGNTQLSSNDTGSLKTTGALVLGKATSAGTDGLGAGAVVLLVDSLTNTTANSIQLSSESGSSFELYAGDGGIDLGRPLTTFQDTVISTTGPLQIDETLGTSGNDLSITASSVTLGSSGSINTGDGTFTCTGTGCTALTGVAGVFWDGGGDGFSWFDPINWSGNALPDLNKDVTIETALGPIVISGGAAAAKSLIALQPLTIASTGSLNLAHASTFSDTLSLSGGSLLGTGLVSVSGPSGSLVWSGGTMDAGGAFLLSSDRSGTLSNTLTLNRLFQNDGTLTLNAATISGTGSITNNGTLTATGVNSVSKMLLALGSVGGSGSLTVSDWSRTGGLFNMIGAASLFAPTGNFVVDQSYSAGNLILRAPGGDIVLNTAIAGTGSGTTVTLVAADNFTNNAGAAAVDAGSGRWLIYSTNPVGNSFGGLVSGNQAVWGRTYPTAVAESGNRYVFSDAGAVTLTTTNANKTYGETADVSSSYALSGTPINGAATYGNVFNNAGVADVFATGPTITSAGSAATASVGGGGGAGGAYQITGTGTANTGYSLTFNNSGLLTIDPRLITVKASDQSRAYGDANPTTGGFTLIAGNLVNGDTIGSVNVSSTALVTAAAGTSHTLANTGSNFTTGAASNYAITAQDGTLSIDPRLITVKASDQSRAYGDANPTTGGFTLTAGSLVNGDAIGSVTVSSAATVMSAAGTSHTLANTGSNFTTGAASNYAITAQDGTLSIDPRLINLAGSRAYDGSTSFGAVAFGTISGVNGETLTVASGAGSVASATVSAGTQTLLPGSLVLGNGSGMASNYTLAGGTHTGTILPDPGNFQWVAGSGGNWDLGANWNQGIVPVAGAMVTIPDIGVPGLSENIVYRSASGSSYVKSLTSFEGLTVSGGALNLGATPADVSTVPQITLAGGALGGAGTLNLAALNLLAGGILKGTGIIVGDVYNTAGTVAPGASAGTLTINGNYVQGPSGMLEIEIGGLLPGAQHDQLVVTGNTTLAGGLDIQLVGGFLPVSGNTFAILRGGGVSGTFATASLPAVPLMSLDYLASAVNVVSDASVNTEQLVAVQVNQTNNAPPSADVALVTVNTGSADGLLANSVYLETGAGQIVPLTAIPSAQPGAYTNIATGETAFVDANSLPDPGVYLSADKRTVIVVILDQQTGKMMVMAGSAEQSNLAVGGGAQVKKATGVCS